MKVKLVESINEAYAMHKDIAINRLDKEDDYDAWESGYRFVVDIPANERTKYNKYAVTLEGAKRIIDDFISYNKENGKNVRPDFAIELGQKARKVKMSEKEFSKFVDALYSKLVSLAGENAPSKEEFLDSLIDESTQDVENVLVNYMLIGQKLGLDVNALYSTEDYFSLDADKYKDAIKDIKDKKFKTHHYDDAIEKDDFPWYVVHYEGDAIYEPAEGGYYVDVNNAVESIGFKSRPQAERYAKAWAKELGFGKDSKDNFVSEPSIYVGVHENITVESNKDYLTGEVYYYGYS